MKIWLVQNGEPSPVDSQVRLMRIGIFSKYLADHGHEVTWWDSTFFHQRRTHRFDADKVVSIGPNYTLRFIHSPGYNRSIGLSRLHDHRILAKRFAEQIRKTELPDIILCSWPTPGLCRESVNFGVEKHIPVAIDIRDLWPDVFLDLIPSPVRPLGRGLFWPMQQTARKTFEQATAITGNSPAFVGWGLKHAARKKSKFDRDFPFAYEPPQLTDSQREEAIDYWKKMSVVDDGRPKVVFFGTIGRQFDLETVIQAARQIGSQSPVQFILCGTGERLEQLRGSLAGDEKVLFPGWVDAAKIWTLMEMAHIGLVPLVESDNFQNNLTNKPIEYLAGGLSVMASLSGSYLSELLEKNKCGTSYGGDADCLAKEILRLTNNPNLLAEQKQNARSLFQKQFTVDKVYGSMMSHLEELLMSEKVAVPQFLKTSEKTGLPL
jgi:glycosyltransferase involved in cell wall biosynthesis